MIKNEDIPNFKLSPQWLAGFFDGEGCIGLYKDKRKNNYDLNVKISQKDQIVLAFIYIHFPKSCLKKGHDVTELEFGTKEVQLEFLNYIKEYSIVKRSQILLAIDFLGNKGNPEDIALQIKNEKFARKERTIQ